MKLEQTSALLLPSKRLAGREVVTNRRNRLRNSSSSARSKGGHSQLGFRLVARFASRGSRFERQPTARARIKCNSCASLKVKLNFRYSPFLTSLLRRPSINERHAEAFRCRNCNYRAQLPENKQRAEHFVQALRSPSSSCRVLAALSNLLRNERRERERERLASLRKEGAKARRRKRAIKLHSLVYQPKIRLRI